MIKVSDDKLITLGSIRCIGLMFGLLVVATQPVPKVETFYYLVPSALIFFIYYYFLINSYKVGEFSVVYPLARGVAPLLVLCLGLLLNLETLSTRAILAIFLVSTGIVTLLLMENSISIKPLLYALGTAMAIACYSVLCGLGVRQEGSFLAFAGYLELFTGIGVLLFIAINRKINPVIRVMQKNANGIIAGLLSVFGFTIALWAMTLVPIAIVAALRETSIIFAGLIGSLCFREGRTIVRISSACLVACGVIVLSLK